eukprot:145618-Pleurochrysis_carterae.AAC.2
MPASPRMARIMSVAPPILNDFPPNSAASRPSVAAIRRASARESVEVHAAPSSATNSGVVLGLPNERSLSVTVDTLSTHIVRNASKGHGGSSSPVLPPFRLRRNGIGVAFWRTSVSLMGTTCTKAHSCPPLATNGLIYLMDAHVSSRVGSNSLSAGCPISPARRRRFRASNAAAHCMRLAGVSHQSTARQPVEVVCAPRPHQPLRSRRGVLHPHALER